MNSNHNESKQLVGAEVVVKDVVVCRGGKTVLDGVSFTLRPGVITGLVGPNAVGKTTLAATIAGRIKPESGAITVGGRAPFDSAEVMPQVAMVGDGWEVMPRAKVRKSVRMWATARPRWDGEIAADILGACGVGLDDKAHQLSLGQKSGVAFALGLAAQAEVTIFDEVTVGMDAAHREQFVQRVLEDYAARPKTVVVSSHLIDEIENLVEDIVVLGPDGVEFAGLVSDLREHVVAVTGPQHVVDEVVADVRVLRSKELGPQVQVLVVADETLRDRAVEHSAVELRGVSLQDAVIALTGDNPESGDNAESGDPGQSSGASGARDSGRGRKPAGPASSEASSSGPAR